MADGIKDYIRKNIKDVVADSYVFMNFRQRKESGSYHDPYLHMDFTFPEYDTLISKTQTFCFQEGILKNDADEHLHPTVPEIMNDIASVIEEEEEAFFKAWSEHAPS